jgi:hypothetical protein
MFPRSEQVQAQLTRPFSRLPWVAYNFGVSKGRLRSCEDVVRESFAEADQESQHTIEEDLLPLRVGKVGTHNQPGFKHKVCEPGHDGCRHRLPNGGVEQRDKVVAL